MRNNPRELNRQGEIVTACNSVHHSNLSSAVRKYRQDPVCNDTKPASLDLLLTGYEYEEGSFMVDTTIYQVDNVPTHLIF